MEKDPPKDCENKNHAFTAHEYALLEGLLLHSPFGRWFLEEYKKRFIKEKKQPTPTASRSAEKSTSSYRCNTLLVRKRLEKAASSAQEVLQSSPRVGQKKKHSLKDKFFLNSLSASNVAPLREEKKGSSDLALSRIMVFSYATSQELEHLDLFIEDSA